MKDAVYTVEQLDVMIEMITKRFIDDPDAYNIQNEDDKIDVRYSGLLGEMYMTFPQGYPDYVQLYIGGAHSRTKLANGWAPFVNHKTRMKVKRLGNLMLNRKALIDAQAAQAETEKKIKNANEAFMKAFPEITDMLLENNDGKESG